jgi:hypothetical protein
MPADLADRRRYTHRSRHQYRRKAWEDFLDPILSPPTAPHVYPGPGKAPTTADEVKALRRTRVEVLRLRHERMRSLWHEDDTRSQVDWAGSLLELARTMKEDLLGSDNRRHLACGVFLADPRRPWGSWRCQPWHRRLGKHVHVGYFASEAAAREALRRWYQDEFQVDTSIRPPAWLAETLADALRVPPDEAGARHWSAPSRKRSKYDTTGARIDTRPLAPGPARVADPAPDGRREVGAGWLDDLSAEVRQVLVLYGRLRPLSADQIAARAGVPNDHQLARSLRRLVRRELATVDGEGRYAPLPGRKVEVPSPGPIPDGPRMSVVFEVILSGRNMGAKDERAMVLGTFPSFDTAFAECERLNRAPRQGAPLHFIRRVMREAAAK